MKKKSTRLKEALSELRYWQGQVRLSLKSLQRTVDKCREVAKVMREIQREP